MSSVRPRASEATTLTPGSAAPEEAGCAIAVPAHPASATKRAGRAIATWEQERYLCMMPLSMAESTNRQVESCRGTCGERLLFLERIAISRFGGEETRGIRAGWCHSSHCAQPDRG